MDFQRCVAVGGGKYNMLYGRDEMALSALAMGAAAAVSSTIGYSPTLRDALRLWAAGDTAGASRRRRRTRTSAPTSPSTRRRRRTCRRRS
jgi:N-acetylneuraminate lyase